MKLRINRLFFIFIFLLSNHLMAQYGQFARLSIGGGVGLTTYFGDLAPTDSYGSTNIKYSSPSFSINASYQLTPRWSIIGSLSWQRLRASDYQNADPGDNHHRYRYIRNLNFRNDIKELSVVGAYDLIPTRDFATRAALRPYAFAGVAVFHHNPQGMTPDGEWVDLQPLRTEGQGLASSIEGVTYPSQPYSLIQVAIPFGIGVKYKVSDVVDVAFEIGYRYLFTDYLDDVSTNYADPGDLPSDLSRIMADRTLELTDPISGEERDFTPINDIGGTVTYLGSDGVQYTSAVGFGQAGDQRGSSNNADVMIVTGFRVSYALGLGVKCPKFR